MNSYKSILVFGSTGSCGQAIIQRALGRRLKVTAYVRNELKARRLFDHDDSNLTIVAGELSDGDKVRSILSEHDAVISCLSSFDFPHKGMSMLASLLVSITESEDRKALRFITYSLYGVDQHGDWVSHLIQNTMRVFSPRKFGPAIQDHKRVASILAASSLNYTLFQTATMIDRPVGTRYESGSPEDLPRARLWNRWGVLDAADVCLDSLESKGMTRLCMQYLR